MMALTRGTQILYVPMHAHGDTNHPDCEAGFVTSVRGDVAFCRYWSRSTPGELRTKANSEATPVDALVERWSVPQAQIEAALREIDRGACPNCNGAGVKAYEDGLLCPCPACAGLGVTEGAADGKAE